MGSLFLALSLLTAVAAAPLFLNASVAPPPPTVLPIAPSTSPSGQQLSVDSASFRLNVQPVVPFAGEYHFSRVPREAWASDLAKIKAGGLTAVSAYVFWLHVEEVQGDQSWTGRNDLGAFLDAAFGAGLWVELRIGPWAHGEARNGGFPDWVQASGTKLRSNTPAFLALVQGWYTQVAAQLVGRYWSDGGAIMSVQLDNETPDVDYLMALRALAIRSGINPFMFVKTGWPTPDKAWPLGALMPSFGGYSDQFWARDLEDDLSTTFLFSGGGQPAGYPFFTVEVGGGMMSSYHRRIHIQPAQVAASAMVILASGTNQLGSYMFVGSSHPKGKLTTMMEQQGVGEGAYNDMPVRTYDFHAPLSECGAARLHYHLLRRASSWLKVGPWAASFAGAPAYMPEYLVANVSDATNLRWAARSDGTAAYVFISTVQPFVAMQAVPAVRLQLLLANAVTVEIPVPASPGIDIPANTSTMWPVRMPLANGLGLMYATATPLGVVPSLALGDVSVFYATSGVRTEFVFNATSASSGAITVGVCAGACTTEGGLLFLRSLPSGLGVAFTLLSSLSEVLMTVLLLDDVTSTRAWIAPLAGATRLMISDALPTFLIASPSAPTSLTVISEGAGASVPFWLFPSPSTVQLASGVVLSPTTEGIFTQYTIPALPAVPVAVQATLVALAQGPPRVIPKGANGVAAAPNQDGSLGEFARAQVYALSFTIPGGSVPPSADLRLVVRYEGDCARLYAGTGTEREDIVEDHFFNGHEFEFPLTRNGFDLTTNLTLRILPKAAVQGQGVYFEVQPAFNASGIAVGLTSVGIVSAFSTALTAAA